MRTAWGVLLIAASLALQSCPSGVCNASNCPSGCCSAHACLPGNAFSECGSGGAECVACASGQQCSAGACIAAAGGGLGGGTGGGSSTGGGSATGGGSSSGGGSATGGGGGGTASSAAGPDGFAVAKTAVMFLDPNGVGAQVGLFGDDGYCAQQQHRDAGALPLTEKFLAVQLTDTTGLKAESYPVSPGASPSALVGEHFFVRTDGGLVQFFSAGAHSGMVTVSAIDLGDGGPGSANFTGTFQLNMGLMDGGTEPLDGTFQTNCSY